MVRVVRDVLQPINALVCLLRGLLNRRNPGNKVGVRLSLLPLFGFDVVDSAFDIAYFRKNGRILLRVRGGVALLIPREGGI